MRRHFRNVGVDADTATITVVGIGDMSGDVFGNGMLLSRHLRLVAAFDHRHVFLDPDPDPAVSWEERQAAVRPPALVVGRLRPHARSRPAAACGRARPRRCRCRTRCEPRLGTEAVHGSRPNELVSIILAAPVDLLLERRHRHLRQGVDRDATPTSATGPTTRVRIDATELRAKVVGEGGNLGLTQRARVEFALQGGFVNTDAIDNSAGVDTSDHEVNSKILLDAAVGAGDLTEKERNDLLRAVTDEVAELVLEDNRAQNVALAIARVQAAGDARRARPLPPRPSSTTAGCRASSKRCPRTSSWPSARPPASG